MWKREAEEEVREREMVMEAGSEVCYVDDFEDGHEPRNVGGSRILKEQGNILSPQASRKQNIPPDTLLLAQICVGLLTY